LLRLLTLERGRESGIVAKVLIAGGAGYVLPRPTAIEHFDSILTGSKRSIAINLGTGSGTTSGSCAPRSTTSSATPLATIYAERPGDVAGGYTKSDRAAELLGWTPKLSLEDGIRSARPGSRCATSC
jgi:UDP-glucose 4-epimerase